MVGIRRHLLAAIAVSATVHAPELSAQAVDLVARNGFEDCWSPSVTQAQYEALVPSFDGIPGCIPETGAGTSLHYCYATTCAGGIKGCPVTFRGGQSAYVPAATRFDASNGIEPFSTLVTLAGPGECTVTFIDTSTVVYQYAANLLSIADGNDGRYVYGLSIGNLSVAGLQSDDYSVTGSFGCLLSPPPTSVFTAILASAQSSIEDVFRQSPLVDQTICPSP